MAARLLEGKPIAEKIKEKLRQEILSLGIKPVLASVQAGEDAVSESYVRAQQRAAEAVGIEYRFCKMDGEITEDALIVFIEKLNSDPSVNGIILQKPLPVHMEYKKMGQFILPHKDAEGIHPANIGRTIFGKSGILPCTPAAVMELLATSGVDPYGKEAVIISHSEIVGKPLSLLLLDRFATVTVCHIGTSKAGRLEEHVKRAEILISAVGKAGLIKGEWIKKGAVVIDVGVSKVADRLAGDVEFAAASKRAAWITPVPGGVGPLTAVMLMRNVLAGAKTR